LVSQDRRHLFVTPWSTVCSPLRPAIPYSVYLWTRSPSVSTFKSNFKKNRIFFCKKNPILKNQTSIRDGGRSYCPGIIRAETRSRREKQHGRVFLSLILYIIKTKLTHLTTYAATISALFTRGSSIFAHFLEFRKESNGD